MKIKNSRVLITGGASGIGRVMGRMSLEKGASCVIIWDINEANIGLTLEEFSKYGKAFGYRVDVSDYALVEEMYARVIKEVGEIDILINCAGVITTNKTFDQNTPQDMERTMRINSLSPMYVTRAILPDMLRRNSGHVCNIASAAGLLSNPKMSVYAASKWAAIGWSDSVRIELQQMKSKVKVTTVAPYYINTGLFDGVKSRIFPILKVEPTCRKILRAIEKDRIFRGIPFAFHFARFLQFLMPFRMLDFVIGEICGVYHTMDNFTGRK